jgi:hypothetical protein
MFRAQKDPELLVGLFEQLVGRITWDHSNRIFFVIFFSICSIKKFSLDDNNQRLPVLMSMSVQVSKPADFFLVVFLAYILLMVSSNNQKSLIFFFSPGNMMISS